jgi:hypothetical protein
MDKNERMALTFLIGDIEAGLVIRTWEFFANIVVDF